MIEKAISYKVGDKFCATLEEAQQHELEVLLGQIDAKSLPALANELIKHADKVIDILTTKATSRVKARKANGAVRKRKDKAVVAEAART